MFTVHATQFLFLLFLSFIICLFFYISTPISILENKIVCVLHFVGICILYTISKLNELKQSGITYLSVSLDDMRVPLLGFNMAMNKQREETL